MRITCLAVLKQGWLGVPLFFLGIATLAFSQLAENSDGEPLSPQEMNSKIARMLDEQKKSLAGLSQQSAQDRLSQKQKTIRENLSQVSQNLGEGSPGIARINANLLAVEDAWRARLSEITKGLSITEGRLLESEKIFIDLKENFAGRIDEAQPALEVLLENLGRSANESNALAQLLESASQDLRSGLNTLAADSDDLLASAVPTAPVQAKSAPLPSTQTGRGVVAAIQSNEAVPLSTADRFGPTIESSVAQVGQEPGSDEMIQRLQIELAASKSVQTELSADTSDLQGDLRKAYREIVSLQANLKDSQMVVEELERTRKSLWRTEDGSAATAQTVSKQINRLEYEVQQAKDDLRQSRQSLLMEQERSNSMIRSISTELERTRRELDFARTAAMNSGADSTRLLALERELAQSKRALQMAQTAPQDASSESYLNLQNELRKALGEMARMQVELGEKDELEEQLLKLRSSLEEVGDSPSRSASPAYVNKLLIDLNAAKKEVAKARAQNSERRGELSETVIALEEELEATKFELDKTQQEFEETKKSIATRELEFATTIQALEEEAQLAQDALREASLGKLPAIPFVEEMEENLANSEARMKSLSNRFDTEQDRASEIIQGLQAELESALIRQKRSMDQLARKQLELEEKDTEVQTLAAEKKRLNEELEVVKVIAGQLQDLNSILEDTKQTQSAQTGNMDEVLTSLKDELNQAKVELVFALEEKDVVQEKSSEKIRSLEMQLEDTRTKLLEEQENLVISTSESKDLLLELKSELDAARNEIARMKTAGLGESVETRQAVSQLQEALGNIRILQQNLEEAEQSNQDVDELRVDLAEAMSTQLNELQKAEDEKKALGQTIDDLETEIAMLREEGKGNSLTTNQALVELQEELKVSQTEVSALEERLAQAEDSGLSTLVVLEDELAEAKMKNQELEKELQNQAKGKSKTVELLEKELTNAMLKLDQIESSQSDDDLAALIQENQRLALQLKDNEQSDLELEKDLTNAMLKLDQIDSIPTDDDLTALIQENQRLVLQLNDKEQSDLESISAMESELSKTLEELRQVESRNVKMAEEYAALQSQLKSLEEENSLAPSDSAEKIEISKLGELIRVLEGEKKANETEIYALREELQKKTDPKSVSSMDPAENNLESQLVLELQGKLEGALDQLAALEKVSSPKQDEPDISGEAMSQLEEELANAELTITNLQKNFDEESTKRQQILAELKSTNEKLLEIEKSNQPTAPIQPTLPQPGGLEQIEALENELIAARDLIGELTEKNLSEENARNQLESRLADAMGKLDGVESSINKTTEASSDGDLTPLREALEEKEIVVGQLKEQLSQAIEELSQKEAELELAKEMDQIVSPNDASSGQEILALQNEIGDLRKLLEQAKQEAKLGSEGQLGMNALQMQLQDAVAESLEMQAELEETKQRLSQMESEVSQPSPNEKYAKILSEAKSAESNALERIDQLTAALRNSEELRKEMERLLGSVSDQPSSQPQDIANNPTFRELQNELAMLQQDLMVARDLADPRVTELQQALSASREDSQRLNEEFKKAMDDFGNIKDQLSNLEAENNRLRNISLAQARDNADQGMASLMNQVNGLEREKSTMTFELNEKTKRIEGLRDQLARAQAGAPGVSPDISALRAQVIRLGGDVQDARDGEGRSKAEAQRLQQELAFAAEQIRGLQESLRQAESAARGLPSRMPSLSAPLSGSTSAVLTASQLAQLDTLRQQNVSLQNQLKTMSDIPGRNALDRRIRDLNQKNLTAQIQLDQERARVEDLRKQLDEARDIKRGVLERGQSANLKVDLLNDELSQARGKIQSLENALINAREAIRVLQGGGSGSNSIPVSLSGASNVPSNSFLGTSSPVRALPSRIPSPPVMGTPSANRFSRISQPRGFRPLPSGRQSASSVQNIPSGDSSVQLKAEVQFLNNKRRPAGFTEFFLVEKSLDSIMQDSMVRIPRNEGIDSYAELWARAIQRGYRFPGVAASIRNSLARSSLTRLKTNSVGEANLDNLRSGSYFVVGASTLGQVGVVWSKPITLQNGENNVKLDLRDAAWAE
jgi:chromosome segregation ATPase